MLRARRPALLDPKPLPILPCSSQRHEALQNLLQIRRIGAGELSREVFGGDGMTRRMQGLFGGADALRQRLRPGLLRSSLLDLMPLAPLTLLRLQLQRVRRRARAFRVLILRPQPVDDAALLLLGALSATRRSRISASVSVARQP